MHDGVAAGHDAFQQRHIADITDDKFDLRLRQPVDVRRIARIRQLVKAYNTKFAPMNPHPPVTRICFGLNPCSLTVSATAFPIPTLRMQTKAHKEGNT